MSTFNHDEVAGSIIRLTLESESESRSVVSNFLRLHDYTDHGILQARILEWVTFLFSRGSSQPRD